MQRDIYYARARNYPSALEAALFPDRVPVGGVRQPDRLGPSPLAGRASLLRRAAAEDAARATSTTTTPTCRSWPSCKRGTPGTRPSRRCWPRWSRWAATIAARSSAGLLGRWCDRYENRGKQSGAFSAGSYDGDPYILMNYQPDVLDHVFTLAHEAGHSMHSYYSAKHQPYAYYNYTIFVAEVASTFNEQLLSRHLLDRARDDQQRAFLINRQIDAMRGTIIRQTMFAEFEKHDPRLGRVGRAADGRPLQGDLPRAAEALFRARLRAGRRVGPGMPADSAFLSRVLRLQVRHRHVGRDGAGRSRLDRRPEMGQPPFARRARGCCAEWGLSPFLRGMPICNSSAAAARKTRSICCVPPASIWSSPEPIDAALKRFGELVDGVGPALVTAMACACRRPSAFFSSMSLSAPG